MTLEWWVRHGNPMLANDTSAGCCKTLGINEVMLRKMELHDIFQISGWGKVAKREVGRWSREHLNKVVEGD